METQKSIDLINEIISDLMSEDIKLSNVLRKVLVVAHKLKLPKLEEWTLSELQGYSKNNLPQFRLLKIDTIHVDIQCDYGFQGERLVKNHPISIISIDKKWHELLMNIPIPQSVNELENLAKNNKSLIRNIPPQLIALNKSYMEINENCTIINAKNILPTYIFKGIIDKIKTSLLTLMLELADILGETEAIDWNKKREEMNNLFDKTMSMIKIENLTANNLNINSSNNIQSSNSGKIGQINMFSGKDISQNNVNNWKKMEEFIDKLEKSLFELSLPNEQAEIIQKELKEIRHQLTNSQPAKSILKKGLNVIGDILKSGINNAIAKELLEQLNSLLPYLS